MPALVLLNFQTLGVGYKNIPNLFHSQIPDNDGLHIHKIHLIFFLQILHHPHHLTS